MVLKDEKSSKIMKKVLFSSCVLEAQYNKTGFQPVWRTYGTTNIIFDRDKSEVSLGLKLGEQTKIKQPNFSWQVRPSQKILKNISSTGLFGTFLSVDTEGTGFGANCLVCLSSLGSRGASLILF